jgi:MFS family permease
VGQSISVIGTWMTRLALGWLVYRLTNSAFLLGLVGFAGQIPAAFLAPLAGVWVDRRSKHRALVTAMTAYVVPSLALAALTFTKTVNIWWVIGLAFTQGVISAFEVPARQSFVIQMVEDRSDLTNAIALNSSIFNAGRLVGPAIAGLVVASAGEAWCFLIDGVSYMAVIAGLLAMRLPPETIPKKEQRVWQEMREGWTYVVSSPPLRYVLVLLGIISVAGAPYTVLPPVLAGQVLKGGANTLGFLMAGSGVGALWAAITLVLRKSVVGLSARVGIAVGLFGAGCALLGLSRAFTVSVVLMAIAGFGFMTQIVGSNTILQTISADDKRGRVMSFYTFAIFGLPPLGSLLCGVFAERFGTEITFVGSGFLCLLAALWFWGKIPEIRSAARPRLVELGILPEG